MTTEAFSPPRFGLPLTLPRPRIVTEWLSTLDRDEWPDPPDGRGQPVMLIPGFLAGDTSLTRMAVWLRTGGYELARSGIAWNTGCMEETVQRLEGRLEEAVQRIGQPALIVGQSRGGAIGRALSVLRPDLVRHAGHARLAVARPAGRQAARLALDSHRGHARHPRRARDVQCQLRPR